MAQAELSWSCDLDGDGDSKSGSSDCAVTYKCQRQCFSSVAAGSELGGPGGIAGKQQLHCGAAGRDVLGTGATEELQGLTPLQHHPE